MLRLVLLAGLSVLSGCSCESLWGAYEIPCTKGFDCPDAAMSADVDMRTGSPSDDPDMAMPTPGDGPMGLEMGNGEMGPIGGTNDIGVITNDGMIIIGRLDLN